MRILQVIQELRPGGAERVVASLVAAAQARGHAAAVAAAPGPWGDEMGADRHFQLPLLGRRVRSLPMAAAAVRSAIRQFRPDVVHAHNPAMAAACALPTRRGRRPPAAVTVHGVPDGDYPAAARVLRLAGLPAVGCGPGVSAALVESGLPAVRTIVNGVTPPPPGDRDAVRDELGVRPGSRMVVAVGRLVPQKHHALAIRAIAAVPTATLVVVGDGPLRGELESEARTTGAAHRVIFTGPRDDARRILGAADTAVLASRWEGLPLVALEALSAGVPLVATAVRGIRELLTDGVDALLAPDGDAAAMSASLKRVLDDPALAHRLADGGRALAASYTVEAMTEAYLALYEELCR